MDLGIAGRTAIVCAASKGLGKACAISLAREGVAVTINSRTAETLEATAEEIQATTGSAVTTVACDITTDEGRAKTLEACPNPDILVNNAGGPPPGDFRDWDQEIWLANMDNVKNNLKWNPKINYIKGLKNSYYFYKKFYEN